MFLFCVVFLAAVESCRMGNSSELLPVFGLFSLLTLFVFTTVSFSTKKKKKNLVSHCPQEGGLLFFFFFFFLSKVPREWEDLLRVLVDLCILETQ